MPCDSIITQSVNLEKCGDAALLAEAMAAVDLRGCYLRYGKLVGDARVVGAVADAVKRAYSERSIYAAAKARGWQVKKTGVNKLQIVRRF